MTKSYLPDGATGLSTPFGMLRYAEEYRRAAALVHGDETLRMPAYNLIGISIELSLKAYLLARGVPLDSLRFRPYGHDLEFLWSEAARLRIDRVSKVPFVADDVIKALNRHYQTHEFRYIKTGLKTVPHWEFIHSVAKALTHGLHDFCLRRRLGKERALQRISLRGKF